MVIHLLLPAAVFRVSSCPALVLYDCTECHLSVGHLLESGSCLVTYAVASVMAGSLVLCRRTAVIDVLTFLLVKSYRGNVPTADVIPTETLASKLPTTLVLKSLERIA